MENNPASSLSISLTEQEFRNIELAENFNSHFDVTESELSFYDEIHKEDTKVKFTSPYNSSREGIIKRRSDPKIIYSLFRVSYSVELISLS